MVSDTAFVRLGNSVSRCRFPTYPWKRRRCPQVANPSRGFSFSCSWNASCSHGELCRVRNIVSQPSFQSQFSVLKHEKCGRTLRRRVGWVAIPSCVMLLHCLLDFLLMSSHGQSDMQWCKCCKNLYKMTLKVIYRTRMNQIIPIIKHAIRSRYHLGLDSSYIFYFWQQF